MNAYVLATASLAFALSMHTQRACKSSVYNVSACWQSELGQTRLAGSEYRLETPSDIRLCAYMKQ